MKRSKLTIGSLLMVVGAVLAMAGVSLARQGPGQGAPEIIYPRATPGWGAVTVDDDTGVGGESSLALAPTTPYTPHMGYAGGGLRYATFDGEAWQPQLVDAGEIEGGTALALEPVAPYSPHLAYYERAENSVKHAYRDAEGWQTEVIDRPALAGGEGIGLAIAQTAPYTLHVAYTAGTDVRYAYKTAGAWVTMTVASGGSEPAESMSAVSLALDRYGRLRLAYHGGAYTGELTYATWQDGSWHKQTVGQIGQRLLPATRLADFSEWIFYVNEQYELISAVYDPVVGWQKTPLAQVTEGQIAAAQGAWNDTVLLIYPTTDGLVYGDANFIELGRRETFGAGYDPAVAVGGEDWFTSAYAAYGYRSGQRFAWRQAQDTVGSDGGTFHVFGQALIAFPPGAYTEDTEITYVPVEPFETLAHVGIFFQLKSGSPAAPLAPGKQYEMTVFYDQTDVPAGADESRLGLFYWDGTGWRLAPASRVDVEANRVTAASSYFGYWSVQVVPYAQFIPVVQEGVP